MLRKASSAYHSSPLCRIWYKYHPEADQDPEKMFKFSFPEFVRFLVNGTKEFADDDYVLRHRGVSYHWENYWAECPVCHNLTRYSRVPLT